MNPQTDPDSPSTEAPRPSRFPQNREVDKQAAELAAKHALPQPPSKTLGWDQMQEYFKLLTPEMWSHIAAYLYRVKPRIIRQLKNPDAPKYIDCIGQAFTNEYIIARHGGGKYLLEVTDSGTKKHGESSHLFRCLFEIDEVRYEPKLNYEELDINHRDNMSYIQMLQHRGILDSKGQVVNNQPINGATAGGVNTEVIKEILGFVSKLNTDQQTALRSKITTDEDSLSKSVGTILLEKMKQDDPLKQVETLKGLLTALKEIVGTSKPDNGLAQIYDRLISMQAKQRETDLEYIKLILQGRPSNPETGGFAQFREVFAFARELLDSGGRSGGRRSGWDIGLDYARELVTPGLQTLNNFLATRRGPQVPIPGAPPAAVPTAPAAFDPYRDQQALRAHAHAVNAQQPTTPNPPTPPTPPPAPPPGQDTQLLTLFQQYAPIIVNALNRGTNGADFGDYVTGLLGVATHAQISGFGEDAILATMLSIPEISLFGELHLRTFVHEFIHYREILDNSPEDEEEEIERPVHPRI
jgi:hypothetical protein